MAQRIRPVVGKLDVSGRFPCQIIATAILLGLVANVAHASDWQYAGYDKKGTVESHTFFDAESISHPSKDVTRVWMKTILARNLDRYNKAHEQMVTQKTARKLALGYSPRFLMLPAIQTKYTKAKLEDAVVDLTIYEVIANEPEIKESSKYYWEIDCAGKRMRLLDAYSFNSRGELSNRTTRPEGTFGFVPPDSNGEWLSTMVCPAK
ncbi:MAG TPA: surface-adhesin E family protein [Burkholderiales bacterium]|nr:surface-adhesin E family protein [Burkholderiales bacterium]